MNIDPGDCFNEHEDALTGYRVLDVCLRAGLYALSKNPHCVFRDLEVST